MVKVFYDPAYVGAAHAFDTTRKSKWIVDSLARAPIPGVQLIAPTPLTSREVERVHDPGYVAAVRTGVPLGLAESQGFAWDPGLWTMVVASNGGAVAAARAALRDGVAGSLSSGLHHARHDHGAGFCTFNGLALAAKAALDDGADSVLILDLDAHCGGGTASLVADESRVWQVDVSVNDYDRYDDGEKLSLTLVHDAHDYFAAIERALELVLRRHPRFGLCLYNAGMDPFMGCPNGGLAGITHEHLARREQMVWEWCRRHAMPIAFVLAGGYVGEHLDAAGLVALHRLTLAEAARSPRA